MHHVARAFCIAAFLAWPSPVLGVRALPVGGRKGSVLGLEIWDSTSPPPAQMIVIVTLSGPFFQGPVENQNTVPLMISAEVTRQLGALLRPLGAAAKDSRNSDPSIASNVNSFAHLWTAKPGVGDDYVQSATACPHRRWTVVVP
jgi:hypothetical protein